MPSPPRILLPDYPVMISTRMESGLPLAARPIIRVILESVLARGQNLFKVSINHLVTMGNHVHIIMRVLNPEDVTGFMDYFKTETAHMINCLLNRRKRTVWESGYDALPLLTVEDVIEKIAYLYTNPQKADLEATIEQYPSVSSWQMFVSGNHSFSAPWVRRKDIHPIENFDSIEEEKQLYDQILASANERHTFCLEPDSWMALFGIHDSQEIREVNRRIIVRVRQLERDYEEKRKRLGKKVVGAKKLIKQPINMAFTPKKYARRVWCLCHDVDLKVRFIRLIKNLISQAKAVTARWKNGDFSMPFPLGLFPPRFPRLANLYPGVIRASI